jgi:hypothetical protein
MRNFCKEVQPSVVKTFKTKRKIQPSSEELVGNFIG